MAARIFSPDTPNKEIDGMKFAEQFFSSRPILYGEMCRVIGRQFYIKYSHKNEPFADGFKRMAYIISQQVKN